jgi:hypothetical protein
MRIQRPRAWAVTAAYRECGHTLVIVAEGGALAGGARVDVEPTLGDVDADEGRSLVHDPVSLDAGLLALVTVRVARTRPAEHRVFARPWWTYGTAGSRRPTRSWYQIGSRQHTIGTVGDDHCNLLCTGKLRLTLQKSFASIGIGRLRDVSAPARTVGAYVLYRTVKRPQWAPRNPPA